MNENGKLSTIIIETTDDKKNKHGTFMNPYLHFLWKQTGHPHRNLIYNNENQTAEHKSKSFALLSFFLNCYLLYFSKLIWFYSLHPHPTL